MTWRTIKNNIVGILVVVFIVLFVYLVLMS